MVELILASKSKVRKEILNKNNITVYVQPSTVDEEPIKKSLLKEKASPEIISKNLAEIKASRVSQKNFDKSFDKPCRQIIGVNPIDVFDKHSDKLV